MLLRNHINKPHLQSFKFYGSVYHAKLEPGYIRSVIIYSELNAGNFNFWACFILIIHNSHLDTTYHVCSIICPQLHQGARTPISISILLNIK